MYFVFSSIVCDTVLDTYVIALRGELARSRPYLIHLLMPNTQTSFISEISFVRGEKAIWPHYKPAFVSHRYKWIQAVNLNT